MRWGEGGLVPGPSYTAVNNHNLHNLECWCGFVVGESARGYSGQIHPIFD